MTRLPMCICLIILFISCGEKQKSDYIAIDQEIEALDSFESKAKYLEKLYIEDQRLRQGQYSETEIIIKYGVNSSEHKEFVKERNSLDLENLIKIQKYITKYGYPMKKEFGANAALTPFLIIQHSATYEDRERNFNTIYRAFLSGEIDSDALILYLGRMYEMKNRERHQMKSPYTAEEEINTLIQKLNLNH